MVFFKKYDTLSQHPLREYALTVFNYCGSNLKNINRKLGHRKAEHFFYVDSTQFGLCSRVTYEQLCDIYGINSQEWFIPYDELTQINKRFNKRFTRTFNLPENQKFKSNIFQYHKDYNGYHPTQKPVALIEDLVKTYTNKGDLVLDNCIGSGTTAVACIRTNRNFIGFELDENYFNIANERIRNKSNDIKGILR